MEYSYFPGCSLESTACEYHDSLEAVFAELSVKLYELEDWNCCGASSAHSLNGSLALLLPARNLAIAQRAGRDVVMPCAACYNRHKTADLLLRSKTDQKNQLEEALGFHFTGDVEVRPLLGVICQEIGLERVRAKVLRPLTRLSLVSYYGCLLVRPPEVAQFDDPENPVLMDQLLEALGAQARPWSHATDCCGGGLSLTRADIASRLVDRLAERAREAGASAIVTSCPLCQMNLEMRQGKTGKKMPVFYFTELIGLAFGLSESSRWWSKHLIAPNELLLSLNLL